MKSQYDEYIEYGGFPEIVLSNSPEKKKDLLNDIISSYIRLDVESLSDFKKKNDFYNIIKMLAHRVGSRIDYAKISKMAGINSVTLKAYTDFFEDTYLIKRVSVFTHNPDREIVKAKKLYFTDTGLANILTDIDSGAQFENTVFNQLSRKGGIRYYSLKNGKEIDFVFNDEYALETKETPTSDDLNTVEYVANNAGIQKIKLIGRHLSSTFSMYIWGGSIR